MQSDQQFLFAAWKAFLHTTFKLKEVLLVSLAMQAGLCLIPAWLYYVFS